MKRTFIELPIFRSRWKAMDLNDDDLARLQRELLEDPKVGPVMQGTGGVRKMRFAYGHIDKNGHFVRKRPARKMAITDKQFQNSTLSVIPSRRTN